MDEGRFDALTRKLGAAATRRGAVAALLGLAGGTAAAAHGSGGRRCRRDSPPEQCCRKTAGKITCVCRNGGTVCGPECCLIGQVCQGGKCVDQPEPPTCIDFGEPCKNVGVPCCTGLVCGSGQGGTAPACYAPAGAPCLVTADCVYGSACRSGVCVANPQPTPTPRCEPSFPVTADAGANGLALQRAVRDATSGATIVLAPGEYRLDLAQDPGQGDSGLMVLDKSVAIERCTPDAVVTIACPPATLQFPFCVSVRADIGSAALRMNGVNVIVRRAGFAISTLRATLTLQDAYLEVTGTFSDALSLNTGTVAALRAGVTLATRATGEIFGEGIDATASNVSCTAPLTFLGYPSDRRCRLTASTADPICGCG